MYLHLSNKSRGGWEISCTCFPDCIHLYSINVPTEKLDSTVDPWSSVSLQGGMILESTRTKWKSLPFGRFRNSVNGISFWYKNKGSLGVRFLKISWWLVLSPLPFAPVATPVPPPPPSHTPDRQPFLVYPLAPLESTLHPRKPSLFTLSPQKLFSDKKTRTQHPCWLKFYTENWEFHHFFKSSERKRYDSFGKRFLFSPFFWRMRGETGRKNVNVWIIFLDSFIFTRIVW